MASVSTSHLIIFVASLVVAAGVVGTLTTGVDRVSSAVQDGSLDVSQQVRTDVTIISDPGSNIVVENGDEEVDVTIHVRNTGSQTIPARESAIDMFLNGQFQGEEDFTIEVQGTTEIMRMSGGLTKLSRSQSPLRKLISTRTTGSSSP